MVPPQAAAHATRAMRVVPRVRRVVMHVPRAMHVQHATMHDQLEARCAAKSAQVERRDFTPHITLMRKLPRLVPPEKIQPVLWRASDFALVESRPGSHGSAYTVVERWALAEA